MNIKEALYNMCSDFIGHRYVKIQRTIHEIQESLTSETKSSAGDKHETGRAMLQLEREKAGQQLAEIMKIKEAIGKIDITTSTDFISLGSVIYTSQHNYFLAISAGELEVQNVPFYAISPNTPIGQLLIGRKEGDEITFRSQDFVIERVL